MIKHKKLKQQFIELQHTQKFQFDDDDTELLETDIADETQQRIQRISTLFLSCHMKVIKD